MTYAYITTLAGVYFLMPLLPKKGQLVLASLVLAAGVIGLLALEAAKYVK